MDVYIKRTLFPARKEGPLRIRAKSSPSSEHKRRQRIVHEDEEEWKERGGRKEPLGPGG